MPVPEKKMFQLIDTPFTFTFLQCIMIHRMGKLQEPNYFRSFMAYYTYNAAKQTVMRD